MIKRKALLEFQEDLKKGMSIEQACETHDISFRDAVIHMPPPPRPVYPKKRERKSPKTLGTVVKYVRLCSGKYYLSRNINKKYVAFGIYYSLEDAVKVRDYCEEKGWKQRKIDEYCKELGVVRVPSKRSKVRYH